MCFHPRFFKFVCCISALLFVSTSFASVEKENIELSRINSVLNSIYPIINAAKKQAVPDERVQFQYSWLKRDIQQIQQGIARKVNTPSVTPRVVNKLNTQFEQATPSGVAQ